MVNDWTQIVCKKLINWWLCCSNIVLIDGCHSQQYREYQNKQKNEKGEATTEKHERDVELKEVNHDMIKQISC